MKRSLVSLCLYISLAACSGGAVSDAVGGPPGATDAPGDGSTGDGSTNDSGLVTKLDIAAASSVVLGRGSPIQIPVKVTRVGAVGKVTLRITGLPAGFTSAPVDVAASAGEGVLTLQANDAASEAPVNAQIEAVAGSITATSPLSVRAPKQSIDSSFGTAGAVVLSGLDISDVLPLDDGMAIAFGTVASGNMYARAELRRFDSGGKLDPSFGAGGALQLGPIPGIMALQNISAAAIAVKGDGSNYVALSANFGGAGDLPMVVMHILANGTVDASFGVGGYATATFPGWSTVTATGLVVQADGNILAAGYGLNDATYETLPRRAVLARFTPTGQLDASFGSSGKLVTTFTGTDAIARGVRIVGGKTYVFGRGESITYNTFRGFIARLDDNGGLDTTFAASGVAVSDRDVIGLDPTPAGKWLVTRSHTVEQLSFNGTKDASFGSQGTITTAGPLPGGAGDLVDARAVGVDSNGRIMTLLGNNNQQLQLWSFDASGARLLTFGGGGTIAYDTPGYVPVPRVLRRTTDGRFLAAGLISKQTSVILRFFP